MTYYPLVSLGDGLVARVAPGEGERVLWIHGYALDSSCWSELWDLLPRWQHLGVDLPGHGQSLPLAPREELPSLAQRLVKLARERQVRHVVALSLGTLVALQMAIEAPGAFATLVLGSPLAEHGANDELFWKRYRELVNMYMIGGHGEHLRGRLMLVEPSPFEGVAARPELWQRLWDIVGRHGFWDLKDAALVRLGDHLHSDVSLHSIESAVLLVAGERERPAARRHAERLSRTLRSCRSMHVLGADGHSLLEAPDTAAAAIDGHLRAHGGGMPDPAVSGGGA
jgi:pimeloyl-[acyl-carrier protein] methyl ester esterase